MLSPRGRKLAQDAAARLLDKLRGSFLASMIAAATRRVGRGALIRFGGFGTPGFPLKSFAVVFDRFVKDLGV